MELEGTNIELCLCHKRFVEKKKRPPKSSIFSFKIIELTNKTRASKELIARLWKTKSWREKFKKLQLLLESPKFINRKVKRNSQKRSWNTKRKKLRINTNGVYFASKITKMKMPFTEIVEKKNNNNNNNSKHCKMTQKIS